MHRLLSFIKRLSLAKTEFQQALYSKCNSITLEAGQLAEGRIPIGAWVFIEEGIVAFVRRDSRGQRNTCDFLPEGEGLFYKDGDASEFSDSSPNFRATEKSVLLWISMEDVYQLDRLNMGFLSAIVYINVRSEHKQRLRSKILNTEEPIIRVAGIRHFFPILLRRVPADELAQWLKLEEEFERALLESCILKYNTESIAIRAAVSTN